MGVGVVTCNGAPRITHPLFKVDDADGDEGAEGPEGEHGQRVAVAVGTL